MKIVSRYLYPIIFLLLIAMALAGCEKKQAPLGKAEFDKPSPKFSLQDTEGNRVELAALEGKVVFINFWATWCPPCRQEMPSILGLYRKMAGKPFVLVTILVNDDPANANAFYKTIGGSLPTLLDPNGAVGNAYGITGVPETFIIDKKGILRKKVIGGWEWDSADAEKLINQYL